MYCVCLKIIDLTDAKKSAKKNLILTIGGNKNVEY